MSLLDDIITSGAEIRARLSELLLRHKYSGDLKSRVMSAYVAVALEHHSAIWLLEKSELTGSAFAMVRPVFDAMLRALWINRVATGQQIEHASRDEFEFPKMWKLRDDIKEHYSDPSESEQAELLDSLLERLKGLWRVLCSYTHSGGVQLGRRFTFDEVTPCYSEREVAEALNLSTVAMLLLLLLFFVSMGCNEEAEETQKTFEQYSTDFAERFH